MTVFTSFLNDRLKTRIPNLSNLYAPKLKWLGVENTITDDGKSGFSSFNIMPNGTYIMTFKWVHAGTEYLQGFPGLIKYQKSYDQGVTWSASAELLGDAQVHNYDAAELVVMPNGAVWAISSKVNLHKLVYKISLDNGETWGAEQDFPHVMPTGGYEYALDNHFARVGDRIFLPIYCRDDADTVIVPGLLYSDNSGAKWGFAFLNGPLGLAGQQGSEASVISLGGDNMMCMFRHSPGNQNSVFRSLSSDRGASWSAPVDVGKYNGGIFPFLADLELIRINANTIVLIAGFNDTTVPGTNGMAGWISVNNGNSWGNMQILNAEEIAENVYHGVEYIGNNEFFITYDNSPSHSEKVKYRKLVLS